VLALPEGFAFMLSIYLLAAIALAFVKLVIIVADQSLPLLFLAG